MSTDIAPAPAPTPAEIQDRQDALAESGWGQPFRFFQPRNLCFWVYMVLVVWGAINIWGQVSPLSGFYGQAIVSGIILLVHQSVTKACPKSFA